MQKLLILVATICVSLLSIPTSYASNTSDDHEDWRQIEQNFWSHESFRFNSEMTFLYKEQYGVGDRINVLIRYNGEANIADLLNPKFQGVYEIIVKDLTEEIFLTASGKLRFIDWKLFGKSESIELTGKDAPSKNQEEFFGFQEEFGKRWHQIFPGKEHLFVGTALEPFVSLPYGSNCLIETYCQNPVFDLDPRSDTPSNYLFMLNRHKLLKFFRQLHLHVSEMNILDTVALAELEKTLIYAVRRTRYFNWFFLEGDTITRLRGILKYNDTPSLLWILSYNIHFFGYNEPIKIYAPNI